MLWEGLRPGRGWQLFQAQENLLTVASGWFKPDPASIALGECRGGLAPGKGFRRCGLMENQEEGLGAAFPPSLFLAGCASGFQRKQRVRRGTKGFNALECLFSSFLQHRRAVGLSQRT